MCEFYYEPSAADEIFNEAQSKLIECLNDSIKNKINAIKEENTRLKKENKELRAKISNIEWREREIESREKNLEQSVLQKTFSEMLKPIEKQIVVWRIAHTYVYGEKCNKCNDNREIEFVSPLGKKLTEKCVCSKPYDYYYPCEVAATTLRVYKTYHSPYQVSITPYYDETFDNDFCDFKLKRYIEDLQQFKNIRDVFEDLIAKYGSMYEVSFAELEDCQKFADYLNENSDIPKDIIKRIKENKECEPEKYYKAERK